MAALVSVSNTGALVYAPGGAQRQLRQMVWLDRDGRQSPLPAATAIFNDPRVSPDGRRIAVSIPAGAASSDIWIYEWARDAMSRLTFDPEGDQDPLWPRRWSEVRLTDVGSGVRNFDVHPDGQRVLAVISPQGDAGGNEVVYASNFFDEVRRLAPLKK